MKQFAKRGFALLLALVLCLSLVPVLPQTTSAATVDYVYSGNYVYNWGERGEACDFLSPMAEAFYADNGVTYAELAMLSGSASTSSVPSSALYKELQSLMKSNHTFTNGYDLNKTHAKYTDCQNSGGAISSFYSGKSIGPSWDGSWNREHTWPNSKGLGGSDENDIMMIRPTSVSENSSRGNTAYGESGSYYDPNDESGGTYNLHGDVARIWLYVYVRWGNTQYAWGQSGVMESKEVLLKWMEEDPVDTWEMGRNDAVEAITGTRNVFVDYPELCFLMFNEDVPTGYESPSGEGNLTAYNITAVSNNTAYGTVTSTGRTITATPKTGYYVQGYTVTSGSATVTQNGNVFNVQAESDCTVRINFAAKTAAQLIYMEDGIQAKTEACYQGDTLTIGAHTGTVPEGYTFVGWVTKNVDETTEKPAVYTVGSSITVSSGAFKLYALYSRTDAEGGGVSDEFEPFSGAFTSGTYLLTYEDNAMRAEVISSRLSFTAVTAQNNVIYDPDPMLIWQISQTADGYYTIYNEATNSYAGGINAKNKAGLLTSVTDYAKWAASGSGVYEFENLGQKNAGLNALLHKNGTYGFGCYSSSTGGALTLYKAVSGTVYYSTDTYICPHEDTFAVSAKEATCTEGGYTAGTYCNDCDRYIEGHEEIAANGHSYNGVVTKPTVTEQGYTTYTCSVCSDSYVSDYTEALGYVYTVSFVVPEGVAAVADMECGKNGITLPTANAPEGYTFLGWTTDALKDSETMPVVYEAGTSYTTTVGVDLYALYSYTVGGSGESGYVLTDVADIKPADEVVITNTKSGTVYAMTNDEGTSGPPVPVAVTVSGDKLTSEPADNLKWNITNDNGSLTIYPNGNTAAWLYCTSANNGVRVGTNSNKFFTVDAETGYLKNTATARYLGIYNTQDWRCYTSTSVNIGGQTLGFYVKGEVGTTYYTTLSAEKPSFVICTAGVEGEGYADLSEALKNYDPATQYIKLLTDVEVEAEMTADLYIDLNGMALSGMLTGGFKVYGMDSATDGYTCDTMGYFACYDENGDDIIPQTIVKTDRTGAVRRYLTIEDPSMGFTFHRFYLGITHANVKPNAKGIGYKAVFAGDEMVLEQVTSFGYTLQLEGNSAVTCSKAGSELVSLETITLRVENYDADRFGTTGLSAKVFMVIGGETVSTDAVTMTLKDMVESINDMTLTDEQKAAMAAWIATSQTMQTWDVGNIYTA